MSVADGLFSFFGGAYCVEGKGDFDQFFGWLDGDGHVCSSIVEVGGISILIDSTSQLGTL
jgi:hypothetical protein